MLKLFEGPILAIETSCDETAAAVVVGCRVLSNAVASQMAMHAQWGGVVPEAAARAHVEALLPTIDAALLPFGKGPGEGSALDGIAAIAVTNRPGLVGALSVGVTAAKALAFARGIPLLGVHHLEGHLSSVFALDEEIPFPHAALIVSGGHTELVEVRAPGEYRILGRPGTTRRARRSTRARAFSASAIPGDRRSRRRRRPAIRTATRFPKD